MTAVLGGVFLSLTGLLRLLPRAQAAPQTATTLSAGAEVWLGDIAIHLEDDNSSDNPPFLPAINKP